MDGDVPVLAAVDFELLEPALATDVEGALRSAITAGVVFRRGSSPLEVFRDLLGEAIRDIEHHPRGELLQRFLSRGPYWAPGPIPPADAERCLADGEVAAAIAFINAFMVNTFQGCLAEILALPSCLEVVRDAKSRGHVPLEGRIYAGESVHATAPSRRGRVKAADFHILGDRRTQAGNSALSVLGVIEVKSYARSWSRLLTQLGTHLTAARRGLHVQGVPYDGDRIEVAATPLQIAVVPAGWHLPRTFRFVEENGRTLLRVDPGVPRTERALIQRMTDHAWHVTLRWSQETFAAAAYELTFWYMAKVGEVIYAGGVPPERRAVTASEAGQNAAKMMLYYAILRAETRREAQRAIALYNAYGFGYALGTSFVNRSGSREMLWPEDLREILERGETKHGCRIMCRARAVRPPRAGEVNR
ncbi:MAG: hypothetical protein ACREF4_02380 [Gammaproteobacteria bacterium]